MSTQTEPTGYHDETVLGQRVLEQAMEIWVKPEIERRVSNGTLPDDFRLVAAQVIMPSQRQRLGDYVRLNNEVRALMRATTRRPMERGETVFSRDIDAISDIRLMDDDDPNAGHLTMLRTGDEWAIAFDFRRDRRYAAELLRLARQYQVAAKLCHEKGLPGPAVETLFAAAELGATAELLLIGLYPYRAKRGTHQARQRQYHVWSRSGNVPPEAGLALKTLGAARSAARYGEGTLDITFYAGLLGAVDAMLSHTEGSLQSERTEVGADSA